MRHHLLGLTLAVVLAGCGAGPAKPVSSSSSSSSSTSSSSSSSASSSSSSSSGSVGLAAGGICELPGAATPETTYLMVISAERYQARLEQLLSLPDAEFFATQVARYTGDALLWEDHAEQRMILAIEAFYRTAESIATRARAVSCVLLSADECGDKFIAEFVEPLYERPLFAEERERYLDFFRLAPHAGIDGQATAMTAALSSPHFLFRLETRDE